MKKTIYYDAILELSAVKSLATISVRDIATHLGISTGSLYYHFTNKDDLVTQMFCFYKKQLDEFLDNAKPDAELLLTEYLEFYEARTGQFKFVYSSELGNILSQDALDYSLQIHLKFLDKLGLDFKTDAHITTIIFGTIRAYLLAPDYMHKCDQTLMIKELVTILNAHKQQS
ncbi:TetR/AcrR family transcriptional regulator [Mollicutes bacterium LVI A0039]|nr:TetR/AcrR family transcriptional regulator [Mollicutes bacterium LVI A0039]